MREFEEKKNTPGYAQSAVFCGRNNTVNSKERKAAFLQERRKRKCPGREGEGMHLPLLTCVMSLNAHGVCTEIQPLILAVLRMLRPITGE